MIAEGAHTLYAASEDVAGNTGTPVFTSFRLDTTAPTITVSNVSVNATSPSGALVTSYAVSSGDNLDPEPGALVHPRRAEHLSDWRLDSHVHVERPGGQYAQCELYGPRLRRGGATRDSAFLRQRDRLQAKAWRRR